MSLNNDDDRDDVDDNDVDDDDVPVVHNLPEPVPEVLPRHPVVGLQVVVEHVAGDDQVARVERVGLVPPLRTKLPPLGHDGVEVAEGEQDGLVLGLLAAHLQRLLGEVVQRLVQVGEDPAGRLVRDLDRRLQDCLGDDVLSWRGSWVSAEEESIVGMSSLLLLLDLLLQAGQPQFDQVDVLENHPVPVLAGALHRLLGHLLLALAQRDVVEVLVGRSVHQVPPKGFHVFEGVHPWGEDEEHGGGRPGFLEGLREGNRALAGHVLGAQLLLHKTVHGVSHPVRTQTPGLIGTLRWMPDILCCAKYTKTFI